MLSVFIAILLSIHIIVSVLIVFVVLMQRPKSEGLGAAFGGGMTENLFGAQTSNVLASFTRWLGGIFFLLTLILSVLYARQSNSHSSIQAAAIRAAQAEAQSSATPGAATSGSAAALTGSAATLTGSASSPIATPVTPASSAAPSPLNSPAAPATGGTGGH